MPLAPPPRGACAERGPPEAARVRGRSAFPPPPRVPVSRPAGRGVRAAPPPRGVGHGVCAAAPAAPCGEAARPCRGGGPCSGAAPTCPRDPRVPPTEGWGPPLHSPVRGQQGRTPVGPFMLPGAGLGLRHPPITPCHLRSPRVTPRHPAPWGASGHPWARCPCWAAPTHRCCPAAAARPPQSPRAAPRARGSTATAHEGAGQGPHAPPPWGLGVPRSLLSPSPTAPTHRAMRGSTVWQGLPGSPWAPQPAPPGSPHPRGDPTWEPCPVHSLHPRCSARGSAAPTVLGPGRGVSRAPVGGRRPGEAPAGTARILLLIPRCQGGGGETPAQTRPWAVLCREAAGGTQRHSLGHPDPQSFAGPRCRQEHGEGLPAGPGMAESAGAGAGGGCGAGPAAMHGCPLATAAPGSQGRRGACSPPRAARRCRGAGTGRTPGLSPGDPASPPAAGQVRHRPSVGAGPHVWWQRGSPGTPCHPLPRCTGAGWGGGAAGGGGARQAVPARPAWVQDGAQWGAGRGARAAPWHAGGWEAALGAQTPHGSWSWGHPAPQGPGDSVEYGCCPHPVGGGSACPSHEPAQPLLSPQGPPGLPCPQNAARERSRVRALRRAFLSLQAALPAVPPGTKLSKLDVLVLATSYIAHLSHVLGHGPPPPVPSHPLRGHPLLHPVKVRPRAPLPQGPAPWYRSLGSPLHNGTPSLGSPGIPRAHQQPAPGVPLRRMRVVPGVPSMPQPPFPWPAAPPPRRPQHAPSAPTPLPLLQKWPMRSRLYVSPWGGPGPAPPGAAAATSSHKHTGPGDSSLATGDSPP